MRDLGLGGLPGGLGSLLEKLTELAEKGEELRAAGEMGEHGSRLRCVYGFTIKTGLGRDQDGGRGTC
jgi:HSP20 family protein